jgi:hypothetical protein
MPKPNYTGGATGAISGAATGSAFGPVGTVAGGIIGGVAGLFGGGSKKKKKRSTLDKNQQRLNKYQHEGILGKGPLADLYNYNPEEANSVFDKTIANPAYRKFKEELAPGITGQFRSNGLMNSSYAGDALSKIARDIQEGLDAQRSQYLYGEQKDARSAKRNAIENIQGNQTFAYDKAAPTNSGFDIGSVLKTITPEMIDQTKNYFNKTPGAA